MTKWLLTINFNKMKIKIFLQFVLLFFTQLIFAQITDSTKSYILSGTVVNGETNELLIGANLITSQHIGTLTDENGTFIITVLANDTIRTSFIGYKSLFYVAPFQKQGKYLIKFKLYTDSINLNEVEIFPWPSYDEFKKAFTELKPLAPEIKMDGVKIYQDRNINPIVLPAIAVISNPISVIYDRLLDKKAKLRRRIDRKRNSIKEATFIKSED